MLEEILFQLVVYFNDHVTATTYMTYKYYRWQNWKHKLGVFSLCRKHRIYKLKNLTESCKNNNAVV